MRSPSRPFSIRRTEDKRFRTVLRCVLDLSLRVLASLRNRPHRPFHDGIRRTKWNYLQGVLCARSSRNSTCTELTSSLVPRGTSLRLNAEPQTFPPGPLLYYGTVRVKSIALPLSSGNPCRSPRCDAG